jgi:GH15 family glucan-1,4-alpha-glucosidase
MLEALMLGGYIEETRAFRDWLLRTVAGDPADIQITDTLAGARRLNEYELQWLPGYEGSRLGRLGNAASGQFQLDVYSGCSPVSTSRSTSVESLRRPCTTSFATAGLRLPSLRSRSSTTTWCSQ